MTGPMSPDTKKSFLSILDGAPDLTVATNRADGFPQATVVSFVHDDGVIYFGCDAGSQKAQNIADDERVSVTVTPPFDDWNNIRGLSMGARAKRVTDEKERFHVMELMLKRFPQVIDFVKTGEMDDTAVFRIEPEVVSILDYAKGFGHSELHAAPDKAA